jgi:hypothetical protein
VERSQRMDTPKVDKTDVRDIIDISVGNNFLGRLAMS